MKRSGRHLFQYHYGGEGCDTALKAMFSDGNLYTAQRKEMLAAYDPKHHVIDWGTTSGTMEDVVRDDLVPFMAYDNSRAIPALDGLKPGQRKVLWYALKTNIVSDVKVAQLAARVAEVMHYHHGEVSLAETIIKMAQDYVGTNNVAALVPEGQFGQRLASRKDSPAASRYIFTKLSPVTRFIFPKADDCIVSTVWRQEDEGCEVEPGRLSGVVPLVLLNGCDGIGTGYRTWIPPHDPSQVVDRCRRIAEACLERSASACAGACPTPFEAGLEAIADTNLEVLLPFWAGFTGTTTVEYHPEEGWPRAVHCRGTYELNDDTIIITELPPTRWTQDVVKFIKEKLMTEATAVCGKRKTDKDSPSSQSAPSGKPLVKTFFDGSSEHQVHLVLELESSHPTAKRLKEASADDLEALMVAVLPQLRSTFSLTQMHLYDRAGQLKRFQDTSEILREHALDRLDVYRRRLEHQRGELRELLQGLRTKHRFITMVTAGDIELGGKTIPEIEAELANLGFVPPRGDGNWGFLLDLPLRSLTVERAAALNKQIDDAEARLGTLEEQEEFSLWLHELDELDAALERYDQERQRRRGDQSVTEKAAPRRRQTKKKKP